mmetsp:Transcript_9542/g.25962  ORF Transcript_9542/g.25962 Transcript_9542/m.25962 type:complete len:260 (+) Transcript_9542:566-1345(+)
MDRTLLNWLTPVVCEAARLWIPLPWRSVPMLPIRMPKMRLQRAISSLRNPQEASWQKIPSLALREKAVSRQSLPIWERHRNRSRLQSFVSPERLLASPQPVHRPMPTAASHQMVPPAMHAAGPATDMCESVPTPATEMELACWEQMQPPTSVLDSFPATVRTHAPAPSDTSRTIPATARELVIETLDTSPRAPALAKTLVRATKATSIPDPALGSALVSTTTRVLGQDLALAREPAPSAIAQLVTTPVWDHLRAKRAWV